MNQLKNDIVEWIRNFFEENGKDCNAIIGISGGIDSSVTAALCVEALGRERVIGVLMPQHVQKDIEAANLLCQHLGIKHITVNIGETVDRLRRQIIVNGITFSEQSTINLPPRIRMATLYAVSQSMNGRVINTSNLSESWVGFDTRYGDSVGDCSPLGSLTKTEIRELGKVLGLPDELVNKIPLDGLCGKTDEEAFGFSYEVLDKYIRTGEIEDEEIKTKIDAMHQKNLFKLQLMPKFPEERKYEYDDE